MKYYFGVDIALRKSGLVVLDEVGTLVHSQVVTVKPKLDLTAAVLKIYEDLGEAYTLIRENYPVTSMVTVLEDVAGFVNIKAALGIHAGRTSAILAYHHSNIPHHAISYHTPNVIKHWLAGQRGAKKDALLAALRVKFPKYDYDSLSEDEIDALALCLYEMREVKE